MTGFRLKVRGGGLSLREYRCPEHGVFDALVPSDAGDEWACQHLQVLPPVARCLACDFVNVIPAEAMMLVATCLGCGALVDDICGRPSPRCFTSAPAVHTTFTVSATQGKSDPKPHPHAMDLRPLGEGQSYKDWKAERAKVHEERRKARVMEMLKS